VRSIWLGSMDEAAAAISQGQHFWARGYFVSTVGRDEALIREYIKNQEREDQRLDQVESLALTCHPRWHTKEGPRQRTP